MGHLSSSHLRRCVFVGNKAWDQGGGVEVDSGELVMRGSCHFEGNQAGHLGHDVHVCCGLGGRAVDEM
jgi:hypothetical protein